MGVMVQNKGAFFMAHSTGVNPAGDAGNTSPPIFWLGGTLVGISPPATNIITSSPNDSI